MIIDLNSGTKDEQARQRARAKRIWNNYRWTPEMYNALGELQHWCCAICGREAKLMPLNVDHVHFHIDIVPLPLTAPARVLDGFKWVGTVREMPEIHPLYGTTKTEVQRILREIALPLSVRGLLCAGRYMGCNRKLGRIDDPKWLQASLDYVKNSPAERLRNPIKQPLIVTPGTRYTYPEIPN